MKKNGNSSYSFISFPESLLRLKNSETTALICGDEELSYCELIRDAQCAACELRARGIKTGDRIAIEMSRSTDYIRIFLGCIFSGAAPVILNRGWSVKQRMHILADCTPVMILDDEEARKLLGSCVCYEDTEMKLPEIDPADPFQILYTSGSTGMPKGVVITHGLMMSQFPAPFSESVKQRFPGSVNEGFPQKGILMSEIYSDNTSRMLLDMTRSFLLATGIIVVGLLYELTIVLADDVEIMTPSAIAGCIRRNEVDTVYGVPSKIQAYMQDPDYADALSAVRKIYFVGEMASERVVETFSHTGADIRFFYASTEAWVCLFTRVCHRGEDILYEMMVGGAPVYLMEEGGTREVLSGDRGEMCIGGAAGRYGSYWMDPKLTEKKFFVHPVYGRLFRTGDMAELETNGGIRVLGRTDDMIKLHGLRIETQAIEKAMEAYPGIDKAAVRVQGEGEEEVLAGYYSGNADEGALRRSLAESLPYYMVPYFLVKLEAMPLNSNGKLDRKALEPVHAVRGEYAAPETEMEKLLCEIFQKVLKTDDRVGIFDSFFALGGDSIKIMNCAALLRERGYLLKPEWIFAVPAARQLAPMIQKLQPETKPYAHLWSADITDEEWKEIESAVPLSNVEAVYPLCMLAKDFARRREAFWLFEIFPVEGNLSEEDIKRRLTLSARSHQALRSVFVGQGTDRPLQVVLNDCELPVFTVDLRGIAPEKDSGELISEGQRKYLSNLRMLITKEPFSSSEVMFKTGLVRISEEVSLLVLAYSHLLLDGSGKLRIWNELTGGVPAVSDAVQYNNYTRLIHTKYLKESRAFWEKALEDHPLTGIKTSPGAAKGMEMQNLSGGEALFEKITGICAKKQITVSAFACLALGQMLMETCDTKEGSFLFIGSGRDAQNIYLTGMFASCFPIYVDEKDSLSTLQDRVKSILPGPVSGIDSSNDLCPGHHIMLSMQNYLRSDDVSGLDVDIPLSFKPYDRNRETDIIPSKDIMILLYPEDSFRLQMVYYEEYFDHDCAGDFGRAFLKSLRNLAEEEAGNEGS